VKRRVAVAAVLAAVWGVAAWLLWRSSLPAYRLPHLDPRTLFPATVLRRAEHFSSVERLFWVGNTVAQLLVLGLYARYGVRFTRESAAGPIGTGMLLGMLGFALVWAAQLPFAVLGVWWSHRYGMGGSYVQATIGNWLALGGTFLFLCLALAIVMGLAHRVGRWWWLPAAPCFIGLTILFAFVTPWLLGGHTFRAPYVGRLERIEHVRHVPVRVLDGYSEPNAFATGLGISRRVFLWKPIVRPPFTPRLDRFVLAHELGHLAHDHIWKSIWWYALFAFPGTYLLAWLTRGRGGMGVPDGVPLAIFVLIVLQLRQLPLQNVISRHFEAEADWSALRATHDPTAGRRLFTLFASQTLEDPSPPWWDYVLLENHPTLLQRIEMSRYYQRYAAAQSP
jgi:STE24 endopeptidase